MSTSGCGSVTTPRLPPGGRACARAERAPRGRRRLPRRGPAAPAISDRARSWLDEADGILGRPPEEYLADGKGRDLAAFYLFPAIQECIDLAAHWIADAGWEAPDEAAALFDLLADRAAITRNTADSMRGATGLRNRIAHGYARVEHGRIYNEAPIGIRAMREFRSALAREVGL
jgi:uncharacterized protein YutE (UPF0331/DUF86 family)